MFKMKKMKREYDELVKKLQEKNSELKKKVQDLEKDQCFLHAEVRRRKNEVVDLNGEMEVVGAALTIMYQYLCDRGSWDEACLSMYPIISDSYDRDNRKLYQKACIRLNTDFDEKETLSASAYRIRLRMLINEKVPKENEKYFQKTIEKDVVMDWMKEKGVVFLSSSLKNPPLVSQ